MEMISMKIIGIAPGLDGCMALILHDDINLTDYVNSWYTPTHNISKNGKKWDYDIIEMADILREFSPHLVVLEKQYGYGYGIWLGIINTLKLKNIIVSPQTWTKNMHKGISGDNAKTKSIIACKQLFPNINLKRTGSCKNDDDLNKAKAILLAVYGTKA